MNENPWLTIAVLVGLLFIFYILPDFVSVMTCSPGNVCVGMTRRMVSHAWGSPDHITTSQINGSEDFSFPISREIWIYESPPRTVVFEDGLVSRVEQVKY